MPLIANELENISEEITQNAAQKDKTGEKYQGQVQKDGE